MLAGSADQVIEHLKMLREIIGISDLTIHPDKMAEFEPDVEKLAGR